MARKEGKPKAVEFQERIDAVREEADAEGLAIVVSWADEYGGMQSVTLRPTDKVSMSPPVSRSEVCPDDQRRRARYGVV